MDTARQLLVAEVVGNREVSRQVVEIPQALVSHRVGFISELGIDLLICGAISRQFEQMLTASGIKTSPWFRGDVADVIAAHFNGNLQNSTFYMPGCGRRKREGRGGRRRGGRGGFGRGRTR
jgi:predicted Fe-Mo cluster-binding NifX family protein